MAASSQGKTRISLHQLQLSCIRSTCGSNSFRKRLPFSVGFNCPYSCNWELARPILRSPYNSPLGGHMLLRTAGRVLSVIDVVLLLFYYMYAEHRPLWPSTGNEHSFQCYRNLGLTKGLSKLRHGYLLRRTSAFLYAMNATTVDLIYVC